MVDRASVTEKILIEGEKMWRYESRDSAGFLSLHDCECRKLSINRNAVVLCMDWMEVLPEHPDNPYAVAHQSGEGQVEFIGCRNVRLAVDGHDIELNNHSEDIVFQAYEILDFEIEKIEDYFYAEIYMVQKGPFKEISLGLIFDSDITRFNELGDESWFVSGC